MHTFSIIMLVIGILFSASNFRDEIRGETTFYSPGNTSASFVPQHASQTDEDSNFRGAMIYNWVYAVGFLIIGGFSLALLRHYDRLDPLSPDFPYPEDDDSSSS